MKERKTVLFTGLNAPGHINPLTGIADRLKEDLGYRCVFLLLGPTTSTIIEEHGHELVIIRERDSNGTNGFIGQAMANNNNEEEEEQEEQEQKLERIKENLDGNKYTSSTKYNELCHRIQNDFKLNPVEAYIRLVKGSDGFVSLIKDQWVENHASYKLALDRINPDLVILDTWQVPPCILNLKHIPWVYLCSANPYTFTRSKLANGLKPPRMVGSRLLKNKESRERLRREQPEAWQSILNEWEQMSRRIDAVEPQRHWRYEQLFKEHGHEHREPGVHGHHSPHLNLYQFPKEIDYDQEDDLFEYPPRWFRFDSLIRSSKSSSGPHLEQAHQRWSKQLELGMRGRRELIYFSLGTLASGDLKLMRRFLDMFRSDQSRLYVISKGVNGDAFELDSSNMIGGNYIPQTFFLQRAQLAIVHGGNNTTTECLHHGVPMIVMPCFEDQQDNAQRIADLELGKKLSLHSCSKQEMLEAMDEVLSSAAIRERVREIGRGMRARDESRKVSLMLRKLVEDKELKQSFIDDCRNKSADEIMASL